MVFDGFRSLRVAVPGASMALQVGGQGPPLLLLHGHPQTQAMWHAVAPALARQFSVVTLDLRGYGDSSRPPSDERHMPYSKRTMAADALQVMAALGHACFAVCAHDRGARVAHRLALDHPAAVRRMVLLDIAPTLAMYRQTHEAFARAYWHWFFLIQPAPLPERLIEADPVRYLHDVMGRRHAGMAAFAPQALAEYERCIAIPGTAHALCEDYRAAASVDLEHDEADQRAGRRLSMPVHVLWGSRGVVGRCFDVLQLWRDVAQQVSGSALDCGHYLAEEKPMAVTEQVMEFLDVPS